MGANPHEALVVKAGLARVWLSCVYRVREWDASESLQLKEILTFSIIIKYWI